MIRIVMLAFICFVFLGNSDLYAQDRALESLLNCRKIKDDADRLTCLDVALELAAKNGQKSGRSTGRAADISPKEAFGLSDAQINQRLENSESRQKRQKVKKMEAGIKKVWRDVLGKYYFLLDNGQLWKETDASGMRIPKSAKKITIKAGALGGYHAYVSSSPNGKVKRLK